MALYGFIFLSLVLSFALVSAKVPPFIKVCGLRNPKYDECVVDSITHISQRLKSGIPELSIPSFEPMLIEEVDLAQLDNFKATATNAKMYGITDFQITKFHADIANQQFRLEAIFHKIAMDADFDVRARVLVPIKDKGPINTVTEKVLSKMTLRYEIVERKGRKLIYFPTMTMKLMIKDYEAVFRPGAEGQNNPVSQAINSVLVNSRSELIESMTPNLEKVLSKKILDLCNSICKHFTYDELFPDRL